MAVTDDERRRIAVRLRAARQDRGLTVRELAGAVGVSPATWSAMEHGRAPLGPDRLAAAAAALGGLDVRPADLTEDWRRFEALTLEASLAGALSAFVELGYHGATVRDIAHRAGLSVPGVYHHWPSKQHLLVALLDRTMTDLLQRSRTARAEGSGPVDRFSRLVECLALFHTYHRELGLVGASEMRSLREPDRSRIIALRVQQQRMVDDEVLAGCRQRTFGTDRPREAARAVVSMCVALPQWYSPDGPDSPEQIAADYVRFGLDLVRHVDRPSRRRLG
jgi:AcrR family transcriptional regulator/DNA-binding XRE family transcriptional regulator